MRENNREAPIYGNDHLQSENQTEHNTLTLDMEQQTSGDNQTKTNNLLDESTDGISEVDMNGDPLQNCDQAKGETDENPPAIPTDNVENQRENSTSAENHASSTVDISQISL